MTCIVGMVQRGTVYIGADSASVAYLRPDPVTSNTRIRDAIGLAIGSPGFHWY